MATTIFSVIGEHRAEPDRLLLLGDDGRFYALTTATAQPTAVQPTDEWAIDPELVDRRSRSVAADGDRSGATRWRP